MTASFAIAGAAASIVAGLVASAPASAAPFPVVDSCAEAAYLDRTAAAADRTLDWDFPFAASPERCLKIHAGQSVSWVGNFEMHPLESDQGDSPNPIASRGASGVVAFPAPGIFGFRCNYHFEMRGAIQVVPAPAPTAVPWSRAPGLAILGVLLLGTGITALRRRRSERA